MFDYIVPTDKKPSGTCSRTGMTIINNEVRQQIAANPDNYFVGNMGFNGIAENF
ncbi:MAG: hypothetical protein PHZ03_11585 [Syntrophomonas sp.]|nr:hypothetical protein [Syntrophomonas sp.]